MVFRAPLSRCLGGSTPYLWCTMRRIGMVSIAVFLLIGCSSGPEKSVVKGSISYKGQPVNGAMLFLYPITATEDVNPTTIPVTQEGTFSTDGVLLGDYKVVVRPSSGSAGRGPAVIMKGVSSEKAAEAKQKLDQLQKTVPPTIRFPEKYKTLSSSDLTCTIGKGEQTLTLELKD
jgi:hypothetical protein